MMKKKYLSILFVVVGIIVGILIFGNITNSNEPFLDYEHDGLIDKKSSSDKILSNSVPKCAISALSHFKSTLKDPSSLQIYGDVYVSILGEDSVVIDFYCNAKNSYGGYVGKERMNYIFTEDEDLCFSIKEDDENFELLDIKYLYNGTKKLYDEKNANVSIDDEGMLTNSLTGSKSARANGKLLAEKVKCEYIEFDW